LVPHPGTWSDAKSYRQALEQHVPLVAWSPVGGLGRGGESLLAELNKPDRPLTDGPLPEGIRPQADFSLVGVTPANVVLSSMRLVPSAKRGERAEVEMRLYVTAGQAADASIRLPRPAISAAQTNFLGEAMPLESGVQIEGNDIRFHLEPWKIITLRIRDR
jgi:alpha-mannosidase